LSWIFQTLPAISDFTLTTAMSCLSPEDCLGFFGYGVSQGKGGAAHTRAEPRGGLIGRGDRSVLQSRMAIAYARP
jgi:hypothetical protein